MDHAHLMDVRQAEERLRENGDGLIRWQRPAGTQSMLEGFAFDVLQHEHRGERQLQHRIERNDMWTAQPCLGLGLGTKATQRFGLMAIRATQHLERHLAIELGVARAVDLAYAAPAQPIENQVSIDAGSGLEVLIVPAALSYRRRINAPRCDVLTQNNGVPRLHSVIGHPLRIFVYIMTGEPAL